MDSERTHELTHQGVKGVIPAARVQATGILFQNFGAAIILGGLTKEKHTGCDIWLLDLDLVIDFIEQPDRVKKTNFWT